MDLKAGLWQQQTLKLTMTPELSQAIALLQYSTQELTAFLEDKALENPLLQIEKGNVLPVNPLNDRNRRKHQKTERDWLEQIADRPFSLEEHLLSQLKLTKLSAVQRKIIHYIIEGIDENGYFVRCLKEIAENLKVAEELVEECLVVVQTLEPAGIGARNLRECLLIQLYYRNPTNELAQKILTEHFVPFAEKKWNQISKALDVTLKDIQDVFDEIQHLNPKPAAIFHKAETAYVIPDAIIEQTAEGLMIRMVDDVLPRIGFNEPYYKKFTNQDQQVSRFLRDKQQDVQWIIKSMEQRKETLTKVIAKIVEKQSMFFQKGVQSLIPMTMKEVANELGIHESTVSRAVREKYVQTPFGTVALKTFFTSTIQTVSESPCTSSDQVKKEIKKLVDKEKKEKPMSDQVIADHLKREKGMIVSRRTIAKYRGQLGIPSSAKRKRFT